MNNPKYQLTLDLNEILQVVNDAVFNYQGKYLTDVQEKIFVGSWNGLTYEEIAQEYGYSYGHVSRTVGYKLWRILSEALGETVQKNNLVGPIRRALERDRFQSMNKKSSKSYWVTSWHLPFTYLGEAYSRC